MRRLDIKTKLYLFAMGANVLKYDKQSKLEIEEINKNNLYVFDSYEDYVNYFKKYIKKVDDEYIKCAILTIAKRGQIIAFKSLCEQIIVREKTKEFYDSFDQAKIDAIHARGKITPMEEMREIGDVCLPGDAIGSASYRCSFFEKNCNECMREFLSHSEEHNRLDFKLINYDEPKVLQKKM